MTFKTNHGTINSVAEWSSDEPVIVTFQYDAYDQIVSSNGIHIAGTFNNWSTSLSEMIDVDGDSVYTFSASFSAGDVVEYKFINGNTWNDAHDIFTGDESCIIANENDFNRVITVLEEDMILDPVCISSCDPCDHPDIDVSPEFLSSDLYVGESETHTMSIINEGLINLNWTSYVSFSDEKIIGNETTGHSTGNEREIVIKDMKQAMKSSTEYLVPENIDLLYPVFKDFVIDGKDGIADPRGMRGVRLQAKTHLIYCSKNMKNNIKQCVEERNNLKIQKYFFSQLGAADCTLSNDQKNLGVCLIDIGAGTTDITLYKSGKIIFSKVLDRGGEYLTDRIAFHLEIPTHKAEEMKLKHGTALENQANNEILKVGNPVSYTHLTLPTKRIV